VLVWMNDEDLTVDRSDATDEERETCIQCTRRRPRGAQ
jgi:hypothetical protein